MRVLYWVEYFLPYIGGIEIVASHLLPAMKKRGHDVVVVTSRGNFELPDRDEFEGIPIYRFPFQEVLSSRRLDLLLQVRQQLTSLAREFDPDLIHSHLSGSTPYFILKTPDLSRVPLVVSLHGLMPRELISPETVVRRILERADWITSVSRGVLDATLAWAPEIAGRTSVIYNGWQMPLLAPSPLPFDPPRLFCAGRLVREKGFHLAIAALAQLHSRHPDLRLVIAGEGPERAELEELARTLGVPDIVEFTGWIPPERVVDSINTITMALLPSRDEGLPNVAIQAALMGRPVVGTRVTGLTEVVVDGETGILVEPDSPPALATAIASLLDQPDKAVQMGQAARARARVAFDWELYIDAHEALYERFGRRGPSLGLTAHNLLSNPMESVQC